MDRKEPLVELQYASPVVRRDSPLGRIAMVSGFPVLLLGVLFLYPFNRDSIRADLWIAGRFLVVGAALLTIGLWLRFGRSRIRG